MTGASSVQMEERNMLRRMERERRSQEVQQEEEEQYHTHTPLFSQPFKRVCGDALSSRIQSMLGDYEPEPQCVSPRALCGPAEPLSPLQTPERSPSPHQPALPRVPSSPLPCRPAPPRAPSRPAPLQKPTAYVRPLDGQEPLRASPEPLQDLKESSTADPQQPVCSAQCVCVLDILQEMTSWPPLLTSIHTPDTEEPQKSLSTAEEAHRHTSLKALEPSGRVELEPQGASSGSSVSNSSSDSDHEKSSSPEQPLSPEDTHTQPQKGSDWLVGSWYEAREHQLSPGSSRDVIVSHDASAQPADSSTHTDRRRTIVCENLLMEKTHTGDASTHTPKHRRKKSCHAEQKKTTTGRRSSTHTGGRAPRRPLLVKIQLSLLSRVPREPDGEPCRTRRASARKRTAEMNEKSSKKKQKLDTEGKRSSSVQHSQSDAGRMKKRSRHTSGLHPLPAAALPRAQEEAEAHGKKTCKSHRELEETENTGALLPLEHRQRSVEDHLKEAKKLKHKADATMEKSAKALLYLEAALAFVQSGVAMQEEPHTHTRSSYTMLSETLELIRFILKLKNYPDSSSVRDRDFFILCLRCQALLQMAMFRYRRQVALRYSRTLAEHFQSSSCSASPSVSRSGVLSPVGPGGSLVIPPPVQQMALAYVSITALVLNAHDTWEQAEQLAHTGSGLLQDLDAAVGALSLSSSISALLQYTHLGLQRLRLLTHTHTH